MTECDLCHNEATIEVIDIVNTFDLCRECQQKYFADSVKV